MKVMCIALAALMMMSPWMAQAAEVDFKPVEAWLKPPAEMETIGPAHGDIAVAKNGDVYVSILAGPRAGIQVFNADGKYLRNVSEAPADFHGFVIHAEGDKEYIYGAQLGGQTVLKMELDGKVVLKIPGTDIPAKLVRQENGAPALRLTGVDVAPDGRIYAVDGYSTDQIHVFSKDGKYEKSFGGKEGPYKFQTNHKICIDTRFEPARILCCDRENRRVVQLSLEGEVLQVIPDMKRPAAIVVFGDWAAVAEIEGRVSLLDKEGKTVRTLGENDKKEQTATNQVKPAEWRTGILTAPHGLDFDVDGNLFVTEFNQYGRALRYDKK